MQTVKYLQPLHLSSTDTHAHFTVILYWIALLKLLKYQQTSKSEKMSSLNPDLLENMIALDTLCTESAINERMNRLLTLRLKECIAKNGVNADEYCKDVRNEYVAMIKDRYNGLRFPPGKEPANRNLRHIVFVDKDSSK